MILIIYIALCRSSTEVNIAPSAALSTTLPSDNDSAKLVAFTAVAVAERAVLLVALLATPPAEVALAVEPVSVVEAVFSAESDTTNPLALAVAIAELVVVATVSLLSLILPESPVWSTYEYDAAGL